MAYKIIASKVFRVTLQRLSAFLERKYSEEISKSTKVAIKQCLESKLTNDPYSGPPSERLLALGIKDYRQLIIDKHNVVFYRVDEQQKTILLLAVMDSRQSIRKLLHEVNLLK